MKMIFLGSGSAFTVGDNFHSNMMLVNPTGKRLLIDCGTDARHALHHLNLSYKDISDVYISHLHADHAGGLEWLGFSRYFDENCEKPQLLIHENLQKPLWENSLKAGMCSLQNTHSTLSTFFDTKIIENNQFIWEEVRFQLVQTQHVYDFDKPVPCFGLFFSINNKNVYLTGDTSYTPDKLKHYYQQAHLIFHDCETYETKSGVHANFKDLCQLPIEIKKKIWLYHYNPGQLPDAKKNGFNGFVKPRQEFEI